MSAFEYVSVLASIVIGLALCDVLISLHRLIRAGRRVRWHWAPVVSSFFAVMFLLMIWWSQYDPNASPKTTIAEHLPDFVLLVFLFLLAAQALPDEVPAEGLNLGAYWDETARTYWILAALAVGWIVGFEVVRQLLNGADPAVLLDRFILEFGVLVLMVSAAVVRRRWWDAVVFLLLSTGPLSWIHRSLS